MVVCCPITTSEYSRPKLSPAFGLAHADLSFPIRKVLKRTWVERPNEEDLFEPALLFDKEDFDDSNTE